MSKRLSSALVLAATLVPSGASAIDTKRAFDVSIAYALDRGRDAGTWYFELDASRPEVCDYAVEWESPSGLISTDCVFEEMKIHGRRSCERNAQRGFATVVSLAEGTECQGFAGNTGLLHDVLLLVMGESSKDLSGVILLDGPSGGVHGIVARPRGRTDP